MAPLASGAYEANLDGPNTEVFVSVDFRTKLTAEAGQDDEAVTTELSRVIVLLSVVARVAGKLTLWATGRLMVIVAETIELSV